jgi:hypothetical protein
LYVPPGGTIGGEEVHGGHSTAYPGPITFSVAISVAATKTLTGNDAPDSPIKVLAAYA